VCVVGFGGPGVEYSPLGVFRVRPVAPASTLHAEETALLETRVVDGVLWNRCVTVLTVCGTLACGDSNPGDAILSDIQARFKCSSRGARTGLRKGTAAPTAGAMVSALLTDVSGNCTPAVTPVVAASPTDIGASVPCSVTGSVSGSAASADGAPTLPDAQTLATSVLTVRGPFCVCVCLCDFYSSFFNCGL
jgi:hypothetical protein